uniref:Uncharacterized protein n=1 Tax=Picea glauca TaxID=3330 RepID=A0A117NGR0_PICGL|nr:hypothetical protein ABT39_MTgene6216 [Picea glauca]QHR88739.1 hypothetical protein Q903MT_gene2753 [Picea sitchensis]
MVLLIPLSLPNKTLFCKSFSTLEPELRIAVSSVFHDQTIRRYLRPNDCGVTKRNAAKG